MLGTRDSPQSSRRVSSPWGCARVLSAEDCPTPPRRPLGSRRRDSYKATPFRCGEIEMELEIEI